MKFLFLLFSSAFCYFQTVNAVDNHGAHESHVHGEAEMTLILQNDELAISFESPAANLVGFEHHPETDQQREALDNVLVDLRNPIAWLQFEGGSCDLASATVNTSLDSAHEDEAHEDEGHEHEDDSHAEFAAEYLFSCQQVSNLESVLVTLQSNYSGIEHIEVQWIINGKQGATELEAGSQQISFR